MRSTFPSLSLGVLSAALVCTAPVAHAANPETIDRMVTGTFGGYTQTYTAGGSFLVFPFADYYVLNDGTSWDSGAGSQFAWQGSVQSVEREGSTLRYTFTAPADGVLYQGTDYSFGDHSAQGTLGVTGPLVLEATVGARVGRMSGYVKILANDATWYDTFNYYSAAVGQSVYFETTFTLSDARFTRDLFSTDFVYNEAGYVDFTAALVPEPGSLLMMCAGLAALGLRAQQRRKAV